MKRWMIYLGILAFLILPMNVLAAGTVVISNADCNSTTGVCT